MSFVEFKVDEEEFVQELQEVKSRFSLMVNTMKSIASLIELNTTGYVPLDTSDLEQSFERSPVLHQGNFMVMMVGYDAVDEESGFHYAEYQHNTELNHPRRGEQFYLTKGITDSTGEIFQMIERDYMSLFFGGTVTSSTSGAVGGDKIRLIRRII